MIIVQFHSDVSLVFTVMYTQMHTFQGVFFENGVHSYKHTLYTWQAPDQGWIKKFYFIIYLFFGMKMSAF